MDSAQNISVAAQYAIGLDTVLPIVDTFELSDLTSQSDEYTDSLTVTLSAAASDANPIVRWMFISDPASLEFPPTESEMWTSGLTEPPATWEFPPETPAGDVVLGAWAMDAAGYISPCLIAAIEYVFMSGPGIVSPPDGLFARPYVPLRLEVVGLEEPITWECDAGTIVGESPWAWFRNIGPRIYSIIASGSIGGEPAVMRTKVTVPAWCGGKWWDRWGPGDPSQHNLSGSHYFAIPVARTYSGKGFLLNLNLSYNSHAFEAREYMGFSYNWTHSYEIYVHQARGGRLELKDGTGGRVVFCKDPMNPTKYTAYDPNSQKNPYGNYSVIERTVGTDPSFGDYHYQMTTKARTQYFFREMPGDNVPENRYGRLNKPAFVVGIRDTNGNEMRFTYETITDWSEQWPRTRTVLRTVTDSAGRSVTFYYELTPPVPGMVHLRGQRICAIIDPAGNTTGLYYNEDGLLSGVQAGGWGGASWSFSYYPLAQKRFRQIETKTDPNSNISTYLFLDNPPGRAHYEEKLNGRVILHTERSTSATGSPTIITNANGDERIEAFSSAMNAWENITDEEGFIISHELDDYRNIIYENDRNGVIREHAYDDCGNRLDTTVTKDGISCNYEEFEYTDDLLRFHRGPVLNEDQTGELLALTTVYQYDSNRNLVLTIEPTGQAGARATQFVYNSVGQVVEEYRGTGVPPVNLKRRYVYEASTGHLLQQYDDPNGENIETRFEYDVLGQKVKTFDGNSNITKFVYDRFGRVLKVIGPCANESELAQREAAGQYIQNTYDGNGNLVQTRDELGRTTTYQYNDLNLQTRVTDALSNRTIYEYDYMGNRTKVIDARTGDDSYSALMEYDKLGRLTKTVQRLSTTGVPPVDSVAITKYLLDGNGNRTEIHGPGADEAEADGIVTVNTYDPLNRLVSTTDPMTYTSSQTYDPRGNVLTVTDARLNTTSNFYDNTNKLVKRVQPLQLTTLFSYDIEGNLLSTTGPWYDTNGNGSPDPSDPSEESYSSYSTYDNLNRLLTTRIEEHPPTSYLYDDNNNVIRVTDPMGHQTTSEYNPRNQVTLQQNHLGEKTRHQYDIAGNRTATLTAADTTLETRTDFLYDELNRLVETRVYPDKQNPTVFYSTHFAYDEVGNKTSETDAKGNTTQFQYDAANRLVKTIDALTYDIEFGYDARGNRTSIWDQNNNQTSFVYDLNNRLTTITEPPGAGGASVTTMTYDEVGNLLTRTDPNNQTIQRSYDALNRLSAVSYPNSTAATFTYDGRGNRKTLADGNAGVNYGYQYDDRGLLTQFTNATWSKTISYQYDVDGKRTQMTTPEGDVITYTHDAADRIDTIIRGTQLVADYDYDIAGRREKLTLGNGCYTEYGYDDLNRLQNVHNRRGNDETISSFSYTHDEVNNRTTITFANGDVVSFGYDARYQLTSEVREDIVAYSESFTYDPAGNRLTRSKNGSLTTYGYNAANQLLNESTDGVPTAYSYDANGNCIEKSVGGGTPETWTYGFDYHNRLVSTQSTTGVNASYVFDYDVRRLSKTVNGATECSVYDGDDIIADYTGLSGGLPGALTASYVNSVTIDSKLARIDGPGSGTPGAEHYYLYDALGSVRNVVDDTGTIENEYVQNAWGEDIPGAGQQTLPDRYQYTGRELDAESGLMHYRNRTYVPSTGRFMQKDPSGMPEGPNRYTYVRNNPVNAVDPWGLLEEETTAGLQAIMKRHKNKDARQSAANILHWEGMKRTQERHEAGEEGFGPTGKTSKQWADALDSESKKLERAVDGKLPNVYTDERKFQERVKSWLLAEITGGDIDDVHLQRLKGAIGAFRHLEGAGEEVAKILMWAPIEMLLSVASIGLANYLDDVGRFVKDATKASKLKEVASAASKIASGHALTKHADDWAKLGIKNADELAKYIDDLVSTESTLVRQLDRGRAAFWDGAKKVVVIFDPANVDKGTAFIPEDGIKYFLELK